MISPWKHIVSTDVGASLQETFWTATFPPNAKYMTVGLRRLALKSNSSREGVIVYLPPSGFSARLYKADEDHDFRLYLANRGWDVFSVDYRSSFIAGGETDISSMAGFKTSVTLSDIQNAIAYIKKITGTNRVFLTGHSTGARYVYLYACARWADDLAGMIPMDGAPWEMNGSPEAENTMDIEQGYAALAQGDTGASRAFFQKWGINPGALFYDVVLTDFAPEFSTALNIYYRDGENAQSPVAGFVNVKEYIASQFQTVWGDKQFSNVQNGYAKVNVLLDFILNGAVDHWPLVDYLEDAYLGNWKGNPPVTKLQFSKNIGLINIPILVFASGEYKDALNFQYRWKQEGYEMVKSTDRQFVLLNGFGHIDLLVGEYAKEQVFLPLYNWLRARKQ